ncbi:TMEM175 family protein [Limosilactobacillus urinaemulieris]|uniref:TMEM175 family protein n=2 Tax=Limosilactobacillus urinaemulieris TaxID=2742600 RepID=UPI0028EB23B0|nr:TMEM175 family protein [Limosilactobacillus urinaemulieris]
MNKRQSSRLPRREPWEQSNDQQSKKMQKKFAEEPNILYSRLSEINTGVLAIVMTIIVLEIQPPANMAHYVDFIHDIGVFLITFLIVSKFWYDLHKVYTYFIERPSKAIAVLDLLLLAFISLMPVMAKWVMLEPSTMSIANYGLVFLMANLFMSGLQIWGFKKSFWVDKKRLEAMSAFRMAGTIVVNILLIGISFINPYLSMILYLGFPIATFLVTSGPGSHRKEVK